MHNIAQPSAPKAYVMGPEPNIWCKFLKVKGNYSEVSLQLKKDMECLIHEGNLKVSMVTLQEGKEDLVPRVRTLNTIIERFIDD